MVNYASLGGQHDEVVDDARNAEVTIQLGSRVHTSSPRGQDLDNDNGISGSRGVIGKRRAAVDDSVGLVVGVGVDLDRHAVGQSFAIAATFPKPAVQRLPDTSLDAGMNGTLRCHGNRLSVYTFVARILLLLRPLTKLMPPHPLLPQSFHHHPHTEWQHSSTSSFPIRNRSLQRQSHTAATKNPNIIDNG